jgi:hypothetical protein
VRATLCGSALDNALKSMTPKSVNKTAQLRFQYLDHPINPPLRRSQVHPSVLPADRCSRLKNRSVVLTKRYKRPVADPNPAFGQDVNATQRLSPRRRNPCSVAVYSASCVDGFSCHGVVGAFAMYGSLEGWSLRFRKDMQEIAHRGRQRKTAQSGRFRGRRPRSYAASVNSLSPW